MLRALVMIGSSALALPLACTVDGLDLTAKSCPCAVGWTCEDGRCLPARDAATDGDADAGAGRDAGVEPDGGREPGRDAGVEPDGGADPGGDAGRPGDAATDCPPGRTLCRGECVDLSTSVEHCGRCDWPCDDGECVGGECFCDDPLPELCQAEDRRRCADLLHGVWDCGACFVRCAEGQCVDGECVCYPPSSPCPHLDDTLCRELTRDPSNCGLCGFECDDGETCMDGTCVNET
ncbi:MAG: hypothetical protein HYY06_19230 [Deltaproteobacteria bacterium]|nr:hypothetical protein [Deltaproteobacteria bacterium]